MPSLLTGNVVEGRAHYDQAVALYDPMEHRGLVTRFGQDVRRRGLRSYRSWAWWMLGYPEAALVDVDRAVKDAREIGHAATLMFALQVTLWASSSTAGITRRRTAEADELVALADEKGALYWKASERC